MYKNALLSCSWRPPPGRSPDPLSEGMWGEVPNKSLAPRCSCSRSTSPILHPDKPRSLGRYAISDFLMGRSRVLRDSAWQMVRMHGLEMFTYAQCLMAWNCPWGSWGNWKAGRAGDKEEALLIIPLWQTDLCRWCLTFIWACSPEYSMDWKMCQVYRRLISVRATYWRYHCWIRTAARIAAVQENRWQVRSNISISYYFIVLLHYNSKGNDAYLTHCN